MKTCAMIGLLAVLAGQAMGQCQLGKIRPNDANANDQAGYSVAVQGDLMLIGTRLDDEKGTDAGAVHVMARPYGYWTQIAKLKTQYGVAGDHFGTSIAFNGDFAMIGAPLAYVNGITDAGAVSVFFHWGDAWFESQRLTTENPGYEHETGAAVAMSGPWGLIGTPGDDNGRGTISWVTIDQNGTFAVAGKMAAPGGTDYAGFGSAVAMDGKWAVIGAPNHNDGNMLGSGETYVYLLYKQGYWNPDQFLLPVDRETYGAFGTSVAIDGDLIVVGSPGKDGDVWEDTGAAYIYRLDAGTGKWLADGEVYGREFLGDGFGCRVAVAGQRVYVSTAYAGEVFVYEKVNGVWTGVDEIVDPDGQYEGWFGSSLATDGKTLAIGDAFDDYTIINENDNGAVYTRTIKSECGADFNEDGAVDIFDFLSYQNAFVAHEQRADTDCNGLLNLFDFLGFENAFVAGCQ